MRFFVKAVNGDNELVARYVSAPDEASIQMQPEMRGHTILAVEPVGLHLGRIRSKGAFSITLFSRELLTLLSAGLSLLEVIEALFESDLA